MTVYTVNTDWVYYVIELWVTILILMETDISTHLEDISNILRTSSMKGFSSYF